MRLEEMIIVGALLLAGLWYGSQLTDCAPAPDHCTTEDILANRFDCGSDDDLSDFGGER
jgi:hypothetical protein